jgi:hypothetical protein
MQKVIELSCEETKAVVGGFAAARPAPVLRKESPLAEIIGIFVRDLENAFGGGKMPYRPTPATM